MVFVGAASGTDADVGDAGILGAISAGENLQRTHRQEGGLALSLSPEDAAIATLAVDGKAGAIALSADEFEVSGLVATLNIRVDIQKLINVAAIARKLVDIRVVESLTDG